MSEKRKPCLAALLAVALLATTWAAAHAESALVERTVEIAVGDGAVLEGTLFLPADAGRQFTILVRTPYGRHQQFDEARYWANRGYAVLMQDTRGKFGSTGEYIPFLNEFDDGMITLDWIAAQDWSNGSVGMWGSSYLAFCQLVLASEGHPALKSIIPISGWIGGDGSIENGGAHHIMLSIPWILHEESQTSRSIADVEMDDLFEFLPLIDAFSAVGIESKIWNEEFDFSALQRHDARKIGIPALHITGWHDFVSAASLSAYSAARQGPAAAEQKLMVGPWIHDQFYTTYTEVGDEDFGPESAMGRERLMELSLRWFDRTLKSAEPGIDQWPDVRLFMMGANEWRDYEQWPPDSAREQKLFIGSDGNANSSAGDGYLAARAPSSQGHDTFLFDPNDPVPTYGGANFHFFLHLAGVKDQREIEARDDVLVYTTVPMEQPLDIVGPVRVVLYAATEGPDTDFTAKLVEVRSSGYARIIEEGIVRASFRSRSGERELLKPGEVYELTVELGATAITIPPGSRLRLEVSSSNFPKYDRNPNNGEEPMRARTLHAVTQKIFHGGAYGSHLVLPVLDQ